MKLKLRYCKKCKHATLQVFTKSYYQFMSGEISAYPDGVWYCPNCGRTSKHDEPLLQKVEGGNVIKLGDADC